MALLKKISLIILLVLTGCAVKKNNQNLSLIMQNGPIRNGSDITIVIHNKSTQNFYLPLDYLQYSNALEPFLSADERRFFLMMVNIEHIKDQKWIPIELDPGCLDETNYSYIYDWEKRKAKLNPSDLFLIKGGKKKIITIPFNTHRTVSETCSFNYQGYQDFKNREYQVYISYNPDALHEARYLNIKTVDSLKNMGYKLYDGELISNKVPLLLD